MAGVPQCKKFSMCEEEDLRIERLTLGDNSPLSYGADLGRIRAA